MALVVGKANKLNTISDAQSKGRIYVSKNHNMLAWAKA
jgi:hypothetical protein